jgi:hypothetical protein
LKGDELFIRHPCGASHEVFLSTIDERKMCARIIWPLAGGYDVDLSTGALKDKKARLWRLDEQSLKRVLSIMQSQGLEKQERDKSR